MSFDLKQAVLAAVEEKKRKERNLFADNLRVAVEDLIGAIASVTKCFKERIDLADIGPVDFYAHAPDVIGRIRGIWNGVDWALVMMRDKAGSQALVVRPEGSNGEYTPVFELADLAFLYEER